MTSSLFFLFFYSILKVNPLRLSMNFHLRLLSLNCPFKMFRLWPLVTSNDPLALHKKYQFSSFTMVDVHTQYVVHPGFHFRCTVIIIFTRFPYYGLCWTQIAFDLTEKNSLLVLINKHKLLSKLHLWSSMC